MTGFRFIHSSDLHLGRRFGNYPEDIRGRLVEARRAAPRSTACRASPGTMGPAMCCSPAISSTPKRRPIGSGGKRWPRWPRRTTSIGGSFPGNHDSLAAEALWDPIRAQLPGNMHFCDAAEPVEIATGAIILPSPVPSRFPGRDVTEWMPGCATSDPAPASTRKDRSWTETASLLATSSASGLRGAVITALPRSRPRAPGSRWRPPTSARDTRRPHWPGARKRGRHKPRPCPSP